MATKSTMTARKLGTNDGALYMWLAKQQFIFCKTGKHAKGRTKNNKKKSR